MNPMSLEDLAAQLGVALTEVVTVATCELTPDEFDDDALTVTGAAAQRLRDHFNGGVDPRPA
jgi:hypothetical protein